MIILIILLRKYSSINADEVLLWLARADVDDDLVFRISPEIH